MFRHPLARASFGRRHGFDPAAGLAPGAVPAQGTGPELDPLREAVVANLSRTGRPVLVFLPEVPSVRLLHAGGAAADSAARAAAP
jgi:hypothetical protein